MNTKYLFIVWFACLTLAGARPKSRIATSESEPETKIREKRKYEIPLLKELQEGGVGVRKETPKEAAVEEEKQPESKKGGEEGEPDGALPGGPRIKKQSANNVCIKVGSCGKTVCGPLISARGPVVSDVRTMLQGGKPLIPLSGLHHVINDVIDAPSKLSPVQGRTVDTIIAPVSLGGMGYGAPATYTASAPAVDLGHSFFKPPTVPAMAIITTPHQPSHPLIHPWLLPHLMPHIMPQVMPSLMSNIGSLIPHRYEPTRFPEPIPSDIKQPPFLVGGDNALLCQPLRNQRLESPYDYAYKPDLAADKSINVTEESKKSANAEEERRIHEHLRKVNEIKEEISQLNRAAQRIVDQQERLTAMQQDRLMAMQQKQLWGGSEQSSSQVSDPMSSTYMGSGYYTHPTIPWGYSTSNILSYPRTVDDAKFFLNLLEAGRKMGLLSEPVQPRTLSPLVEPLKGALNAAKSQKDVTDEGSGNKSTAFDKKLTK